MKISKVDHTKSAVVKNPEGIIGILFPYPAANNEIHNISRRFNKLKRNAQKLYQVFALVQTGKKPVGTVDTNPIAWEKYNRRRKLKTFIDGDRETHTKGLNDILSDILFEIKTSSRGKEYKTVRTSLDEILQAIEPIDPVNQDLLNESLMLCLRKSLRKKENGLKCLINSFSKSAQKISPEEKAIIKEFIQLLENDYNKNKQGKLIKKSIENQNGIIQPEHNGTKFVVANKNNIRKADFENCLRKLGIEEYDDDVFVRDDRFNDLIRDLDQSKNDVKKTLKEIRRERRKIGEKIALNEFLLLFADLDEEKRSQILRILSRMVDLYFNASEDNDLPAEVHKKEDFNVWDAHEERKTNTRYFVGVSHIQEAASYYEEKKSDRLSRTGLNDLKARIREENKECYLNALNLIQKHKELFFEQDILNEFWIHHIENSVERILKKINEKKLYQLEIGYLSEKVWKDILNYISIKYIAFGKNVFNYGMEDLFKEQKGQDITFGEINQNALNGITSFDLEQIKADEQLQRETAVVIAFAANNLSRATVDIEKATREIKDRDMSDFLVWKREDLNKYKCQKKSGETLKRILQFFGGRSRWRSISFDDYYENNGDYEASFLYDLKEMIYSLRNESFHFSTANRGKVIWNQELIGTMFAADANECISYEKAKFYSNDLPSFYPEDKLERLLTNLYSKYVPRASQVPSFNSVFARNSFPAFLSDILKCRTEFDKETNQKWQSAVYYAFKEIYYNMFLPADNCKALFKEALEKRVEQSTENDRGNEAKALNSFSERCRELENCSFSEMCQMVMTEYNAQNSGNRKVKSSKAAENNPDVFRHYKMLLLKLIADAFVLFIQRTEELKFFLTAPEKCYEKGEVEGFLPEWKSPMFDNLIKEVKEIPELQKWYIVSRLLNGKTLNHLLGSLRSYIQYREDIKRRAAQTRNVLVKEDNRRIEEIDKIIEVINMCSVLSWNVSNDITDYFDDKEDYARYLSDYLEFDSSQMLSDWGKLDLFCNRNNIRKLGIYMDEENPIVNRNLIMSKLFGPGRILRSVVSPVTVDEIVSYYSKKEKIAGYMTKNICKTMSEQEAVLDYQKKKNRIEFRTFCDYGELINDLLGQLVNWSYLRERDLLYFQIGFHYLCLNNPNAVRPNGYETIKNNETVINNAILYQIASLYINGLGIYDGKYRMQSGAMMTGSKIGAFLKYSETLLSGDKYGNVNSTAIYYAGLEVFENIKEHDNIIDVRNTIDHFKYYTGNAGSILDLFSEVFDRFFTYDMKYRKNIVTILENILLRYFVIIQPEFCSANREVGKEKQASKKPRAQIRIKNYGLSSDEFTYKIEGGTLKTAAKDEDYLRTIAKILYYPQDVDSNNIVLKNKNSYVIQTTNSDKKKEKKERKERKKNTRRSIKRLS